MVIFDYFKAKERNIKDINYDIISNEGLLENKIIENLILEISPKKRDEYSEIIELLSKKGYYIYDIGLSSQRKLDEKLILIH